MNGPTDQDLEDLAFKLVRGASAKWRAITPDRRSIVSRPRIEPLGTRRGNRRRQLVLVEQSQPGSGGNPEQRGARR